MSSRFLSALLLLTLPAVAAERQILRVCADPNNLPFSNSSGEGFENRLAELIARDMGADLQYTWWAERKSFLRNSLNAGRCDVVMGVPSTSDAVSPTKPYYRSTYVFVSRSDRELNISSLTDARLEQMRIGIHVVGDDYAPPAHLLARRGLSSHIVGYSLFGKYGEPNPPARLIEAVGQRSVDIAIVWGPLAGYFAKQQGTRLTITPVSPAMFLAIPFTYEISAAVRKGEDGLRAQIDNALARECRSIAALLSEYGVPRLPEETARCESSQPASSSWR
jgi:mxaJ protein